MSALVRAAASEPPGWGLSHPALPAALALTVALGGLLLAPGDVASTAHHLLHGICAQRPSHSLTLGGVPLPLDARMTGIYLGAAAMSLWLTAARRWRAAGAPPRGVVAILLGCVLALAADGTNALLFDLGAWHPYPPANLLRLLTGLGGGLALGAAAGHVFAAVVWRDADRRQAVVVRPAELAPPTALALGLALPPLSGWGVFLSPYAAALVLAVVSVFWQLSTALIVVAAGRGRRLHDARELSPLAMVGLAATIATIGGLAALRFAAERWLGLPQLT
jgi:hypothetical protein